MSQPPRRLHAGPFVNAARALAAFTCFAAMSLCLMPLQAVVLKLKLPWGKRIPLVYHRVLCALLGVRVEFYGSLIKEGPALYVTNHTSWLDIPILSAIAPVSFVAKREVRNWPFFGLLAQLQRSVFIERGKRSQTEAQRERILARLADGDILVLFPEGTSSDGNRVLPFNSALFSVAEREIEGPDGARPVVVQPISLAYVRYHGMPMGRRLRPKFAWYGDMVLMPHLLGVFAMGPVDVIVHAHAPVTIRHFGSRKALSRHCQTVIGAGIANALAGRPEASGAPQEEGEPSPVPAEAEPLPAGAG